MTVSITVAIPSPSGYSRARLCFIGSDSVETIPRAGKTPANRIILNNEQVMVLICFEKNYRQLCRQCQDNPLTVGRPHALAGFQSEPAHQPANILEPRPAWADLPGLHPHRSGLPAHPGQRDRTVTPALVPVQGSTGLGQATIRRLRPRDQLA